METSKLRSEEKIEKKREKDFGNKDDEILET